MWKRSLLMGEGLGEGRGVEEGQEEETPGDKGENL